MIREGPIGSAGAGNASDWMQEAEFLLFLEYFKKQAKPTIDQKCLQQSCIASIYSATSWSQIRNKNRL